MKKKLFTMVLATSLVLGMSSSVFAAYAPLGYENGGSKHIVTDDTTNSGDVYDGTTATEYATDGGYKVNLDVTNTTSESCVHVIAVAVDKTDLTFTFDAHTTKTWNPVSKSYDAVVNNSWSTAEQTLNVVNYSDVPVIIAANVPGGAVKGTTFSVDKPSFVLAKTEVSGTPATNSFVVDATGDYPVSGDNVAAMTLSVKVSDL